LPGAIGAPFFGLHAPPALAHNVVLLAVLSMNGFMACRIARGLGLARLPSLLAGVGMVALPFFAKMQGELPILAIGGTLASLDGVIRFAETGRRPDALEAAAGLVVQAVSCQQLTPFAIVFVVAAGIFALRERRFARDASLRLGGALGAALALVYVLGSTPLAVHDKLGFKRAAEVVESLSAKPSDFFTRPLGAVVPLPPVEDASTFTGGLFPGVLLLALAGLGVASPSGEPRRDRWRWYLLGASIAGALLALGLNLSLFGWQPFALLRELPGFAEVRSVFRCAVFLQMHLVILAALGLAALAQKLDARRATGVVVATGLLAAAENLSLPAPLVPMPTSARTAWSAFIASQPEATVVAHVPFPAGRDVEDFAPEAWRMFAQIDHRKPLVNGYSSNFPAVYREFMFAMGAEFPKHILACALHTVFGADLLVVDQDWLASHRRGFAEVTTMLEPAYADASVAIFRMKPSPDECPPMRIDVGPQ
jgi:hypothetical protein